MKTPTPEEFFYKNISEPEEEVGFISHTRCIEILQEYASLVSEQRERKAFGAGIKFALKCVNNVKSMYPYSVFPKNGESQDCKSADMARLTCDNIVYELTNIQLKERFFNDYKDKEV